MAGGTCAVTPGDLLDGDDVEYTLARADWERQEAVSALEAAAL